MRTMAPAFDIGDYARRYSENYQGDISLERALIGIRRQHVLQTLARHPHRHVLEIGCGMEPVFCHVGDFETWVVVEPAAEFVEAARSRAAGGDARVEVVQGFFEDVAEALAARHAFDVVILSSLLHEVPEPDRLLAAVRRACQPSTVVHVNVPNVRSFHRLLAYEMGLTPSIFEPSETEKRFQRHTRYDKSALLRIVEAHGFAVLRFETYFVKPFSHDQMEALIRQGIVDAAVVAGLTRMIAYMPELGAEMLVEAKPQ